MNHNDYDLKNIIYRTKSGQQDAVMDAKLLFVDLVKLFYHVYEYLQKKDKEKKSKQLKLINNQIKH